MVKVEERKREVEAVLEELDTAGPVTKQLAQQHERRRRDRQRRLQESKEGERQPQQQQQQRPPQRRSSVVDVEAELEEMETEDDEFFFVHVGWLQRWLNGQTEKEWSDEQAERVGDGRGRPAAGAAKGVGNRQADAIVLDEDDDVAPGDKPRLSPPLPAESPVVRIDVTQEETIEDDAALLTLSSPQSSPLAGTAASSSPSLSSSSSSPSPSVLLDDADPLWPGSLYASNSKLCCPHGFLDPRPHCLVRVKRISARAWQRLVAANLSASEQRRAFLASAGVEPATEVAAVLNEDSLCAQCVRELRDVQRELESQRSQYELLLDGMKEFTSTSGRSPGAWQDGEWARRGFLLHKRWFRELSNSLRVMRQKAFLSTPFRPDSSENINAGLLCPHGQLVLDRQEEAYLISPDMWAAFLSLYPSSSVFPAASRDCPDCTQGQREEMRERKKLAEKLQREQAAVSGLKKFLRATNHLTFPDPKRCPLPGQRLFLLPAGWVQNALIPYQQQAEVDSSAPVLVQPSPAPMAELLCSAHGRLRYNPVPLSTTPQQQSGRGSALPGVKAGVVTYCEPSVWRGLVDLGYVKQEDAAGVWLQARSEMDATYFGVADWSSIVLECSPPPCLDCIRDSQRKETDRLRLFEHGSLKVKRIANSVPIASAAAAAPASASSPPAASSSSSAPAPGSLSPASSTRGRRKRSVAAVESFTAYGLHHLDDVSTVKMKLSQYCAHSPAAMRLWYAETELRDGRPLVEYGVEDGGELLMKVEAAAGLWEADFMDFMPSDDLAHNADVESGFAGTKLTAAAAAGDERRHSPQPATPSSAAARPARREAAAQASDAGGPRPAPTLSQPESKPQLGTAQPRPRAENGDQSPQLFAAPVLPKLPPIPSPPLLPALDAVKTASAAPLPAASPPLLKTTMVSSAFLASLLRPEQRQQQPLQPDSATTSDEALARQLSAEEERKRPAPLQSAEEQQQDEYARQLHEEEQQAVRRRRAEREQQERAGLAAARELNRQLRREQQQTAVWVEHKEGSALGDDADGDLDEAADDPAEDDDDDDGDYSDREEKQARRKSTDKKAARGRAGDRGAAAGTRARAVRGRALLRAPQNRGRASRSGRKLKDDETDSDDEREEQSESEQDEEEEDDDDDAPSAPPAAARGRRTNHSTRQKTSQSAAAASHGTPFACASCTFLNEDGGDRCGMCATERGAAVG